MGGVYNSKGATFTLAGNAVISGNVARQSGGGVYNDGNFIMNGGTIQGHKVKEFGGGVYNSVDGTFTMKGGLITKNVAMDESTTALNSSTGGGVFNSGTFKMHGGVISYNTAAKGGGIQSGIDPDFSRQTGEAIFTMDGGRLSITQPPPMGAGCLSTPVPLPPLHVAGSSTMRRRGRTAADIPAAAFTSISLMTMKSRTALCTCVMP